MREAKSKNHDFHFIIDQAMQKKLRGLRIFQDMVSFSALIVRILRLLYPRLEKEHFAGCKRGSRYQLIAEDKAVRRCSVHIYLPEDLYKRLKLMHQDLDFYSIGQLVRWMIRLFLELVDRFGNNFRKKLMGYLKSWRNQNSDFRYTAKKMRQLLNFISQNPEKISILTLYNTQFSPILIYRC